MFPENFKEFPRGNLPTEVPVQETLAGDGAEVSEGQRERPNAGCSNHHGVQTRIPGLGVENEPQAAWSLLVADRENTAVGAQKGVDL